jgi:CO/xanthine dehydrogenase Mo-binding subunit
MIVTSTTDGNFLAFIGHTGINPTPSAQTSIIAEALGVNEANVQVGDYGNTATTQNCGNQGGSTRVITAGTAALRAGQSMLSQLFTYAAPMLNTTPDKLSASGGKIFVTANPSQSVTHAAVLATTPPLVAVGVASPYTSKIVRTAAASCAQVAVDAGTGQVTVKDVVVALDCGRAVHWQGVIGHLDGGTALGTGWELMWGQVTDPTQGVVMNPSFRDNHFPGFKDVPLGNNVTEIVVESGDSFGPYGAKGVGEPSLGTQHVAISNAIYNAIGVWVKQQPATPDLVLKALGVVV